LTLIACDSGRFPDGFAQRLADATDRVVLAPAEPVASHHLNPDGAFAGPTAQPWITFIPNGADGGWDTINDAIPTPDNILHRPIDGIRATKPPPAITAPTTATGRPAGTASASTRHDGAGEQQQPPVNHPDTPGTPTPDRFTRRPHGSAKAGPSRP